MSVMLKQDMNLYFNHTEFFYDPDIHNMSFCLIIREAKYLFMLNLLVLKT